MMMNKQFTGFLFAATLILGACKKNKDVVAPPPPPQVSPADKIKDTVLLYSRDIYLWHEQIPSTFNARNYADPDKIMTAIRPYSKETGFTTPVDRWSFAYKKAEWDNVSGGVSQDFGLNVFFLNNSDLRVKAVEKRSPAGIAGIKRGWRITKIDGNTNITVSNANYIIQTVFNNTTTAFTFQKPDGTTTDITLNAASYTENPIYLDSVYTTGTKKAGYMVFNSFLGDTTEIYSNFQRIFNRFAQEQVNDVIVDLRYNGGGFVSVHDKLANYLANNTANGDIMMNQQFNQKYSMWNESTKFSKVGTLNLPRVFFIVSSSTASASELLINNLKPYMDVKVVGPEPTYGKPVGYFPIGVGDWYIFPVSFRSTNKSGSGNYFNGFPLDYQVEDGLDKDWGDKDEKALASVLKFIGTGAFAYVRPGEIIGGSNNGTSRSEKVREVNRKLDEPSFKGTIDTRRILK